MATVTIHHQQGDLVLEYNGPVLLSTAIREGGLPFEMPCAGSHRCGKCRVRAAGELAPPTEEERLLLERGSAAAGERLACMAWAQGPAEVWLAAPQELSGIVTAGRMHALERDTDAQGIGAAVDIGTTTVASYLYDRSDGRLICSGSEKNPQGSFGADVISRIEASLSGGGEALQRAVAGCLNRLVERMCEQAGLTADRVESLVVTGNTTMLYLLTGSPVQSLAAAPFKADRLFGCRVAASDLGLKVAPGAQVYLPRCISAYVGADITTAVLSSGMTVGEEPSLLVDIGTNGEMALYSGRELLCCSTAAGPAFEGAGIQMGMPAMAGAIDHVSFDGQALRYTVIGAGEAAGLCGSGIIDAVAALLRAGIVDETGLILQEGHPFTGLVVELEGMPAVQLPGSRVVVTQADLRAVQLAKSAICAGIETLMMHAGLPAEQLSALYLAGGFGSYIDPRSAGTIGLIPQPLLPKVQAVGNAAGMGAAMILLSRRMEEGSEQIGHRARTVDLTTDPFFNDRYIEGMLFPPAL